MTPSAGSDTRQRILEVAARLFYEQGYHATGVATILREAGVNSGSLYHFFPSKEALLVGVLEYYVGQLRPQVMEPAEAAAADPIERVFALLARYRQGLELFHCKMGCPIGNLALEVADDHPEARALINLNFRNWAVEVRRWLDADEGRLPVGVDRVKLAHFVLTVMEGGIMQARAAGHVGPFDDSVAQLRAYFDLLQEKASRGDAAASRPAANPKTVSASSSARGGDGGSIRDDPSRRTMQSSSHRTRRRASR